MTPQNFSSTLHIDSHAFRGEKPAKQAFVFLHGFPGLFTRNEDLAAFASARFQADSFVPHLSGIGQSKGEFLFSKSIENSISLIENILASNIYEKVNLVGHSWGGFITLTALRHFKKTIHRTMLLSPFTVAPPVEAILPELSAFVKQQQLTGKSADLNRLTKDMAEVLKIQHPRLDEALAYTSKDTLLVIQANEDTVMPAIANRSRYGAIGDAGSYLELNDNHWFTNRPPIFSHAERFFSSER